MAIIAMAFDMFNRVECISYALIVGPLWEFVYLLCSSGPLRHTKESTLKSAAILRVLCEGWDFDALFPSYYSSALRFAARRLAAQGTRRQRRDDRLVQRGPRRASR